MQKNFLVIIFELTMLNYAFFMISTELNNFGGNLHANLVFMSILDIVSSILTVSLQIK